MLSAVRECTETYDWVNTDFVTDRISLYHLLRWLRTPPDKQMRMSFGFDIHLAGDKTLILTPRTQTMNQDQKPSRMSFGRSFEQAETSPVPGMDDPRMGRYDRIVSYVGTMMAGSGYFHR